MQSNKMKSRIEWFCAILLYVMSGPFFAWDIIYNTFAQLFITIVLSWLFYQYCKVLDRTDKSLILLFAVTLIYSFVLLALKGTANIFGLLSRFVLIPMVFLAFGDSAFTHGIFKKYVTIYSTIMLFSILCYPFVIAGVMPSMGYAEVEEQDRIYQVYPFFVREVTSGITELARFNGPFDEPGMVGTYGALLLYIERFKIKNWKSIVILVSGLLSMSMFFYAILFSFTLIYLLFVKRSIKYPLLIVSAIIVFYSYTKDNNYYYNLLWKRFEWSAADGQFSGDNRIDVAADEYYKKNVVGSSAYWFGLSDQSQFVRLARGSASYKIVIAQNGIIYFSLYLSFFVFLARRYRTNNQIFWMFCMLLLLNTYQRPSFYAPIMIFLYSYAARMDSIENEYRLNRAF